MTDFNKKIQKFIFPMENVYNHKKIKLVNENWVVLKTSSSDLTFCV